MVSVVEIVSFADSPKPIVILPFFLESWHMATYHLCDLG